MFDYAGPYLIIGLITLVVLAKLAEIFPVTHDEIVQMQAAPTRDLSVHEQWARRQAWRDVEDPHDVEAWGVAYEKYVEIARSPASPSLRRDWKERLGDFLGSMTDGDA